MDISYYKKYEPIDGKWYITKELGSGAYGTVFEVERKDYGNMKAAMKVITIPSSPSELKSFRSENYDLDEQSVTSYFYGFVEEFVKEFQLMAELKGHSNIVSYEDHDIVKHSDGIGWDIFIRMELLKSMNDHYADNPPTVDEVVKLGIHICKALEVCKEFNIIHRDIKPSNIFVSRTGEYKLGDFGVARTLEKTSSGLSKKGTYTYMAPEVFKGESYGANVDIYSLGIVMYRLLNNNLEPFRTDRTYANAEMALEKRMKGEALPEPMNADKNLSKIILKACSYSPKERYQSATEMREALESLTLGDVKTSYDNMSMENSVVDATEKTESIFGQPNISSVEEGNILKEDSVKADEFDEKFEKTQSVFDIENKVHNVEFKEPFLETKKDAGKLPHTLKLIGFGLLFFVNLCWVGVFAGYIINYDPISMIECVAMALAGLGFILNKDKYKLDNIIGWLIILGTVILIDDSLLHILNIAGIFAGWVVRALIHLFAFVMAFDSIKRKNYGIGIGILITVLLYIPITGFLPYAIKPLLLIVCSALQFMYCYSNK